MSQSAPVYSFVADALSSLDDPQPTNLSDRNKSQYFASLDFQASYALFSSVTSAALVFASFASALAAQAVKTRAAAAANTEYLISAMCCRLRKLVVVRIRGLRTILRRTYEEGTLIGLVSGGFTVLDSLVERPVPVGKRLRSVRRRSRIAKARTILQLPIGITDFSAWPCKAKVLTLPLWCTPRHQRPGRVES